MDQVYLKQTLVQEVTVVKAQAVLADPQGLGALVVWFLHLVALVALVA